MFQHYQKKLSLVCDNMQDIVSISIHSNKKKHQQHKPALNAMIVVNFLA